MWQGTVTLQPGLLIYTGQLGAAHRHRHAAVQVVVAQDDPVRLRDESGTSCRGRAAVIPSGVEHETAGSSAGMLVWVDADGMLGQALTSRVRRTGLPADTATAWVAAADPLDVDRVMAGGNPRALADLILGELADAGTLDATPAHPAVRQAVAVLPAMLDDTVHLGQIAKEVGLSASRLGHLFSDELGLPFRAYVRWARLRRAIDHVRAGGTLTEAAHAAGFADSAHLTRVCHEMFGLAPSLLAGGMDWQESVV
ncbi:helix-turn-helix transcriptional regulator [Amycolatopsis roodepoortensis]|uniref:helix-turn-helix domain-containing protein n=1 Tax=Amycolatopsis roodepoortensis TaxID=700274 RepID=UPI00214C405E|nr:helix-turn-helix transcriptional regulator [Amycolatopsis roodepoortensis]UUV35885.1 helix-turn-helix transcriptional regulator [Amycolatopsis roodepoortensis]